MNNVGNLENYQIFLSNPKTDGMEVQPYFDHFQRHHIPFLYRLPYLPNNTKMTKKYGKIEPVFPGILPTVFTLTKQASCVPESRSHATVPRGTGGCYSNQHSAADQLRTSVKKICSHRALVKLFLNQDQDILLKKPSSTALVKTFLF
jgi:hypothetical protein